MTFLIILSALAAIFHNLIEANTLKNQLEAAGKTFSFKEHVKRNYGAWLSTAVLIVILAISHPYVLISYPTLEKFMWIIYLLFGWGGSDFGVKIFSSSQKRLTEIIAQETKVSPDEVTNTKE